MRVYLVRHGESEGNLQHYFTGQVDSVLTACGWEQAQRIAAFFRDIPLAAVYASDLTRAMQTAQPTAEAQGLSVIPEAGLREICGGEWEALPFEVLPQRYPEAYRVWLENIGCSRPTGGESPAEVAARAEPVLFRIAEQHPDAAVAVITHGCVIRSVLTKWETGSVAAMRERPWTPNASVTELVYENGRFRVQRLGIVEHLDGLVTELPKNI